MDESQINRQLAEMRHRIGEINTTLGGGDAEKFQQTYHGVCATVEQIREQLDELIAWALTKGFVPPK